MISLLLLLPLLIYMRYYTVFAPTLKAQTHE
jgi:hypothetical protein